LGKWCGVVGMEKRSSKKTLQNSKYSIGLFDLGIIVISKVG